jgi:SAM-dependent methyltransferase
LVPAQRQDRITRVSTRVRLLLASFLMLFLELALIRWLGSNVLHLSYFNNVVLLGSFLGVGLGFLRAGRNGRTPLYFPIALAALVVLVRYVPVTIDRSGSDLIFFTSLHTVGPPVWVVLPVVFTAVATVMTGPGELVGRCFLTLPRLDAYRWDLIGSLLGITAFATVSFLRAPSLVWGLIVVVLTVVVLGPARSTRAAAAGAGAVVVGMLLTETLTAGVSWSPYYKVETVSRTLDGTPLTAVLVNGIPHQNIAALATRLRFEPQYSLPYQRTTRTTAGDVLVVGAGNGVDVAQALTHGATAVDAVEIDPRIQQLGQELNPDRPYADPRVHVHIDDGRAFLQRTDHRYDTIIFALPDSLTLVAGASQIRLESYLFTVESMRSVHDHLRPGGVFAMYNGYREEWLVGRYANTVAEAFGHRPCVDTINALSNAVLTVAREEGDQRCDPAATAISGPPPVTDSRPFPYLRTPSIPAIYLWTLAGIVLISLLAVRGVGGPLRRSRPYLDLFFLGAAFLLLETRAVTGFALLFGTTWLVNAIVFAGVLLAVLLAVEVTRALRRQVPRRAAYAALAVALAVAAAVPVSWLLGLPLGWRLVASVAVAFVPIFTANVVFASRFEDTADPATAFGVNLVGAMVGGCLEYSALIIGYPALIGVAALLYLAAFLSGNRVTAARPLVPADA